MTGGGTLSMQGGLGGADNFARIRNDGVNQRIDLPAGGAIVLTGGNGPDVPPDPLDTANNFARIENRSLTGVQTIHTGTIALNGALTGANNFTGIQAAHQVITTTGNVTLQGGPAENSGARIGAVANTSPTDLLLTVGGELTMNGGSATGSAIGSNREGGQTTDIVIMAAGDITLNPGAGASPRIGSPESNVAGGDISITSTGGNIVLNAGSSILTLGEIAISTPGNLILAGGTGADLGTRIVGGSSQTVTANKRLGETCSSDGECVDGECLSTTESHNLFWRGFCTKRCTQTSQCTFAGSNVGCYKLVDQDTQAYCLPGCREPGVVPGCSGACTVKSRASATRNGSHVRPQGP